MSTTWNVADSVSIALSGTSGLTATTTVSSGAGVRSIDSLSSGKYYFEITPAVQVGANTGFGIGNASASLTGAGSSPANASFIYPSGNIYVGVTLSGGLGNLTMGVPVCIALDVTGRLIWYRKGAAGNWNASGTANPATGVGGLNIAAAVTGNLYAFFSATSNANESVTANFGDSAFAGVVPAGFTAGIPGTVPTGTFVSTVLAAREALVVGSPAVNVVLSAREVLVRPATPTINVHGVVREIVRADTTPANLYVHGIVREVVRGLTSVTELDVHGLLREVVVAYPAVATQRQYAVTVVT